MSNTTPTSAPTGQNANQRVAPLLAAIDLRDYFAAKAMHQFLNGAVLPVGVDASEELAMLAARAYEMADAMIAARTQ